ncbi:DUF4783 domain-containing protein [Mucilaginibacter sp. AW1-3]
MKVFLLAFVFSFFSFQQKADPVEKTAGLIRQSSIKELVKTFASSVELTILADEGVYSREQAETILTNFFTKNPISSVKIIHRVDSNPALKFGVCTLSTKNGNFRTSFSLRNNNGNYEVSEMRIEEEKAK